MILEMAILRVKPGTINDFERDFRKASPILAQSPGYVSHELHKCVEEEDKYLLLVRWNSITDHMVGFRRSESYRTWTTLLHPYYDPLPTAEHYVNIKL